MTGSAGFIGGWVVRLLLDKDYVKKVCDHVINISETVNRVIVTSSIAAVMSGQNMQELAGSPGRDLTGNTLFRYSSPFCVPACTF